MASSPRSRMVLQENGGRLNKEVLHPVKPSAAFFYANREMGTVEKAHYGDTASGLVPLYQPPQVDSFMPFPQKNSTPRVHHQMGTGADDFEFEFVDHDLKSSEVQPHPDLQERSDLREIPDLTSVPALSPSVGSLESTESISSECSGFPVQYRDQRRELAGAKLPHLTDELFDVPLHVGRTRQGHNNREQRAHELPVHLQGGWRSKSSRLKMARVVSEELGWSGDPSRSSSQASSGQTLAVGVPMAEHCPHNDPGVMWVWGDNIDEFPLLSGLPSLPVFPHRGLIVDGEPTDRWGRPQCSTSTAFVIIAVSALFPPAWLLVGSGFMDELVGVIPRRAKQVALLLGGTAFLAAVVVTVAVLATTL